MVYKKMWDWMDKAEGKKGGSSYSNLMKEKKRQGVLHENVYVPVGKKRLKVKATATRFKQKGTARGVEVSHRKQNYLNSGWRGESSRHAMARMGIRTGNKSPYRLKGGSILRVKQDGAGYYYVSRDFPSGTSLLSNHLYSKIEDAEKKRDRELEQAKEFEDDLKENQINQAQKEIDEKFKTAMFPESIKILEKQQERLDKLKDEQFAKKKYYLLDFRNGSKVISTNPKKAEGVYIPKGQSVAHAFKNFKQRERGYMNDANKRVAETFKNYLKQENKKDVGL